MSTTQPGDPGAGRTTAPRPVGRLGPWFAAIWLFFLVNPLAEGWAHRDEARGVLGIVATLVFSVVYLGLWVRARADRHVMLVQRSTRVGVQLVAALVALGGVMVLCLGESGLACVVYIGVACVMVFPAVVAGSIVAALVVVVLALSAVEDWGSQASLAFGLMAASVAVYGLRAVMSRNIALIRAHEENAALAVENERTRFARDLHDILGHSLTVITVKAELAQRLMDIDVERARAEIGDLERLSRDALADVRRAVEGYRDLTLPGELTRAKIALGAAEIRAELPNATDEVPSDLRELFAWTVREGVTNVIRHSGARACEIRLTPTSAEVRDDGHGCPETPSGSGLTGLRERAAAVGATVVTRDLSPGHSLQVVRG